MTARSPASSRSGTASICWRRSSIPSKRGLVAMVSRSADAELNAHGRREVRHRGGARLRRARQQQASGQGRRARAGCPEKGARRRQERRHDRRYTAWNAARGRHGHRHCWPGFRAVRSSPSPSPPAAARCWRGAGTRRRSTCRSAAARSPSSRTHHVAKDADEAEMERKRQELTEALNAATAKAYALVDGAR